MQKTRTIVIGAMALLAIYLGQDKIASSWHQLMRDPAIGLLIILFILLVLLAVARVLQD